MGVRRQVLGSLGCVLGLLFGAFPIQGVPPEGLRAVRITVEIRGEPAAVESWQLVARPVPNVADAPQPVVRALPETLPVDLTLNLDPEWSWRVRLEAPGVWSIPAVVGPQDHEAHLEVLPTAPIELRTEAPREGEPPAHLAVEVRPAPGERAFPVARIDCLQAEDVWHCEVPAGTVDLKIAAADYVPVYLWGLRLEPGKVSAMDAGELQIGASLSGFVSATEGDAKGARVRLEPVLLLPQHEGRENTLAAETTVNDREFFLLAGIPPGEYLVSARKRGYATARSEPVRVEEGSETRLLSALRLEPPVDLEVFVSPPVDPFGERWEVEARRDDRSSRRAHPAIRHPATDAGAWVQRGLEPAHYLLRVFDSRGSRVVQRQVDVTRISPPVELDVEIVPVEGRVLLGDEPLEADLTFSGIRGGAQMRRVQRGLVLEGAVASGQEEGDPTVPDYRRVRFATDTEGRFDGYLPHEGFWEVEVDSSAVPAVRLPEPIEVRRLDDGGSAEIEVLVPDTRLEVRVRDQAGRPAADVALTLRDPRTATPMAGATTDSDGVVSLRGLPELPLAVEARGPGGASATVQVEPRSGQETRVELVLAPRIRVEGVVASRAGPVPGVLMEFRPAAPGVPVWTTTTTGADGRFRFLVPGATSAIDVIVLAPGLPLRLARLPIEPSDGLAKMDVLLDDVGGTLRLDFEAGADPTTVQVAHGGAVADLISLVAALVSTPERFSQDGDIVLPLEAGAYTICSPAPECQQVFLSPGGTSEVVLDGAQTDPGGS